MPAKKITVNLSPAGTCESRSRFDLPLAISVLAALGLVGRADIKRETFDPGRTGAGWQCTSGARRPAGCFVCPGAGFGRCLVPMETRAGGGTGGGHCLRGDKEPDGSSGTVETGTDATGERRLERFLKTLADYPVDFRTAGTENSETGGRGLRWQGCIIC